MCPTRILEDFLFFLASLAEGPLRPPLGPSLGCLRGCFGLCFGPCWRPLVDLWLPLGALSTPIGHSVRSLAGLLAPPWAIKDVLGCILDNFLHFSVDFGLPLDTRGSNILPLATGGVPHVVPPLPLRRTTGTWPAALRNPAGHCRSIANNVSNSHLGGFFCLFVGVSGGGPLQTSLGALPGVG